MKKFICGLLAGLILSVGFVVFGAEQFTAHLASFPVFVNGEKFVSDKPIVVIDGSTYLPVKAISDVLGVRVEWNNELSRVEITNTIEEMIKITRVIDGDTFEIEGGKKVRLIGVDTPESVHPDTEKNTEFGKLASDFTKDKLEGKKVKLVKDVSDTDRYGRLLRYVYLEDGTFYNELLVKEGYAKAATFPPDVKYVDIFVKAEQYARENNKGLWAYTEDTISEPIETIDYQYIGSKESNKYHLPTCRWAKEIEADNLITFKDKAEAETAGYEPCGVCNP